MKNAVLSCIWFSDWINTLRDVQFTFQNSGLRAEIKKGKILKCAIHIPSSIKPIKKSRTPSESAFRALFRTVEIFTFGKIEVEM